MQKKDNNLIIESIIKKLFVQFRFNFEYLGEIESDPIAPYRFLCAAKDVGIRNLDGSTIRLKEDKSDPFGLDRVCHLNSFMAYGHPAKTYVFRDDKYQAHNHITHEVFSFIYNLYPFDLMDINQAAAYLFPTDYNFYEESLTNDLLSNGKYENGYNLPMYDKSFQEVFEDDYLSKLGCDPYIKELKYKVDDHSEEMKDSIIIINFALTMLFNIVLVESAFVDLFGFGSLEKKIDIKTLGMVDDVDRDKLALMFTLYSCLHCFVYLVTYGIYRNRYGMTNDLNLITPHGSFYYGTDVERRPFKDVLQESIALLINYKYEKESLEEKERDSLINLASLFGIGYWTNVEMGDANKHFWKEVDFSPSDKPDRAFICEATENSPLWRMWYRWWGAYWSLDDCNRIIKGESGMLDTQQDQRIPRAFATLKQDFLYETSFFMKDYMKEKIAQGGPKKEMYLRKYRDKWADLD